MKVDGLNSKPELNGAQVMISRFSGQNLSDKLPGQEGYDEDEEDAAPVIKLGRVGVRVVGPTYHVDGKTIPVAGYTFNQIICIKRDNLFSLSGGCLGDA